MAFFKFRQRGQSSPNASARPDEPASSAPQETIDTLRRRARHRLVGASVLVLVAIVGFPLLFDTQPRPVPVDAAITIPDKDRASPLRIPDASPSVPAAASLGDKEEVIGSSGARTSNAVAAAGAVAGAALAARAVGGTRPTPPERVASAAPPPPAKASEPARAAARSDNPDLAAARAKRDEEAKARREKEAKQRREAEERSRREEAARARALLEGRSADKPAAPAPAASAAASRFIVQVGAFGEADKMREVRHQAERAGIKTYTQVVQTRDGPRTRVRVGPYASREEAEKAVAVLKKAGLGGAIVGL